MIICLACDPSMTWVKLHLELVSNARSDFIMFWCNHREYESLSTLKVIWTLYNCTFMQLLARVPKFWKTLYLGYLEILQKCLKILTAFIFSFKWKMYNFFNNDININNASLHAHLRQCIFHFSRTSVCDRQVPALQTVHHVSHNHKEKKILLFWKNYTYVSAFPIVWERRAGRQCIFFVLIWEQECWNNNKSGWCKYILNA